MARPRPMHFWAADWLSSQTVRLMTPAERGGYIELIAHCWDSGNASLPADEKSLARLSGLGLKRWRASERLRSIVIPHPQLENRTSLSRVFDVFLEDQEHIRKCRENGERGAEARWQGHVQAMATPMANACPPSTSTTTSPSPLSLEPTEPKKSKKAKEKKDGATPEQIALCKAYESEMAQKRRLSVACSPTPRNLGYLACVSLGREHAEALEVVRGYVRLEDPFLVERAWPLPLLESHLAAAVREAGKLRAAAEAEASLAALDAEEEDRRARRAAQTPEERAAEEAQTQRMLADWRAMGSRRVS